MEDVTDLARYPIDRPGSPGWRRLVNDCRAELDRDGLFNLPGFLRQEALARAVEIFPRRNTARRVTAVRGPIPRIIAVFSYYERPGMTFTPKERRGLYGRPA